MLNRFKKFFPAFIMCIIMASVSCTTAYAAPEDYLDDIWNGISSAVDDINDRLATEPNATATEAPTEYAEPTSPPSDAPTEPQYTPTEPQEQATTYHEPENNDSYVDDYDYSQVYPTEATEQEYAPEILTETYTDAPFIERLTSGDGSGNLFVALGIWAAIVAGIIIVVSIVIATHKRKKGNA